MIIVFDVTDRESFERVESYWIPDLENHWPAYSSDVPGGMVLVGNKVDEEERVISEEEAFDLAQKLKIPYIETSAKTAHNVVTPFSACIIDIFNKWGGIPKTLNVKRAKS